jgi:PAS domain S-box-containing protein
MIEPALFPTLLIVALLLLGVLGWAFFNTRRLAQQERDRFFTLTRDLLCMVGFDGYFKKINPAWEEIFGYGGAEFLNTPFVDFIHPDDIEKTQLAYEKLKTGQEVISFENRYRCRDGSYRWLLWNARAHLEDRLIFASARDLTERKKNEEALRQNEEHSRSIIERALDAFVSIDEEGRIWDWNLQAEAIFGWPRGEAVGRFLHETIIPPQYRESHLRGIRHLQATGEGPVLNKRIELTALRRNGEEFPVEIAIWPLRMRDRATFHAFISDITARKLAEARIQELHETLRRRANQLEEANQDLEAFSYSVSHDLRAPLRHVQGFIELLQESPALANDVSGRHYMTVIARAAEEMGRLIDALLAFSRTGRAKIQPAKINVRAMVDQVIEELQMETKGRAIAWDIGPLTDVTGDSALLRLVWTNLISNALKYTRPRSEARIEIGCEQRAGDQNEVIFHLRDNGVGFDMRYVNKLFGVFQRLHRAEDFEGTGIGLANVQRIVSRHGGRVWAESAPDCGATFYFSLPLIAPLPSGD